MKEEIRRIMKLVQEGKLSPEDAAELIDAFGGESERATPPPPPEADGTAGNGAKAESAKSKDPFKGFVDWAEGLGKDVSEGVNWQEIADQVRTGTKKSWESIRQGVEKIREGKINLAWFSTYESREISLPLRVPEGKTLRIENPCGGVKVVGGMDEGRVNASATIRGADEIEARENAEAFTIVIEENDHQVLIRQHDVSGVSVDLEVLLDSRAQVEVKAAAGDVSIAETGAGAKVATQSGEVTMRKLDGTVEATSQSGRLRVDDVTSPSVTLESKSGDIALTRIAGNINARSASGDVTLQECSGKSLSIESVSGDVHIDLSEPVAGTVNVRTVNGSAALAVADGSDCRVSLSTLRGEVLCDIVLQDEARMEQHVTGRLGQGSGSLDVSAVNGNITLRLREHAATAC